MMSICDACIDEINHKLEEKVTRREAARRETDISKTEEIKALAGNYLDKTIGNPQIREINISKHAHALRFLRFTDYMLVISCGYWLLSIISLYVIDPEFREGGGLSLTLVVVPILSFGIYTAYRHLSVIDSHVWRAHLIAFPMLLLLFSFFIASIFITIFVDNNLSDLGALLGGLILLSNAGIALGGLVSVLLLRKMRIAPLSNTLIQLLSNLRSHKGKRVLNATTIKRINVPLGILFVFGGGIIILVNIVGGVVINLHTDLTILSLITNPLSFLGFLLLIRARRYFQVSADSLLSIDKRKPILFLRSFEDDGKPIYNNPAKAFLDFSLETRLSNHFTFYGPFIAIGSPKESIPEIGAARVKLSDSEWQPRVTSWMSEASLIIMYSGATYWVNWELAKVIEMKRVTNLILMIPEFKEWIRRTQSQDINIRIEYVKHILKNTRWSSSLARLQDFQDVRVMLFSTDGSLTVIRSRPRNRDAYHLAALIAHYLKLNQIAS